MRAARLALAAWTLAVLIPSAAAAEARADAPSARSSVERENERTHRRAVGVWRARVSIPQKVSAGVGWVVADVPVDFPCTAPCEYRGALVQLDAGLSGAQIAAGWAVIIAGGAPDRPFRDSIHIGFGIKGCLLRTWGDPWGFAGSETFAGAEVAATVSKANLSLGVYRSLAGDPEHRWRLGVGLGYGF